MSDSTIKLTTLSHGGGCGCKIGPTVLGELLGELLASTTSQSAAEKLLVGADTRDDAAVYALSEDRALVATTDFFTPIVDDPEDFGRIAAANAISDVYAMGAKPLFALNIAGMPIDKLPRAAIAGVIEGGRQVCEQAGIVIAGGHSIDSAEPIYGLAVIGEVHPGRLKRNAGARAGDALILSKPLGIGAIAAAFRHDATTDVDADSYGEMLHWASLLNKTGEKLGAHDNVHAMTDVTGYGLLGHLSEMCEASGVGADVCRRKLPAIEAARALLAGDRERGVVGGGVRRNREALRVDFGDAAEEEINLMCDPQTNGGLLVACAPEAVDEILALFKHDGCDRACVIGRCDRPAGIRIVDAL